MNTQKIDDVNVAAMLFTLGFEQEQNALQVKKRNGKTQFLYFFRSKSECGQYSLNECLAAWKDDDFIKNHPFHQLSVAKAFSINRNILLDEIHLGKGLLTEIEHDESTALVNLNASEEELAKLFA